ncbi:MAG: glutamine-hydrolyzing carbamoyl-phosphate synthase small subunit [Phycisphaeraceae bacterium]|nr:glutamine-hydrolyzing carbamoyl-phosphate synthase small subunit [Phycisphaeraceae bacterium]
MRNENATANGRHVGGLGRLALADGSVFRGEAFGAIGRGIAQTAEIVFNTAMSGYQEAITDPSYSGQVLVFTAPLIGNTGVNGEDVESAKVQAAGIVVRELARVHSNFRATMSLPEYLAKEGVLGVSGVDTRALTMRLRVGGAMAGIITDVAESALSDAQLVEAARNAPSMAGQNLVPRVGCSSGSTWRETLGDWSPRDCDGKEKALRVLALDCGAKRNILRNLADRGCVVDVVPHDISAAEVMDRFEKGNADGLFVSNGPGDPAAVERTIAMLREVVGGGAGSRVIPTFGICLGHQLLALALGAKTYKLKFGHRGVNQPVLNLITGRVEITSQNHGFAVEAESLAQATGDAAQATHINLNDQTLAGFCLKDRPLFAVQHHPEASPGPHDSTYLFDAFVRMMEDRKPMSLDGLRAVQAGLGAGAGMVG